MASLDEFLKFKAEIDALNDDIAKAELPLSADVKDALETRIEYVIAKMERFWAEAPTPAPSGASSEHSERLSKDDEPEAPAEVLVKQAGRTDRCKDCGSDRMPCACFSHLPRPKMIFEEGRLVKIAFPEEFNSFDRLNWLKAMKLRIAQRRGK